MVCPDCNEEKLKDITPTFEEERIWECPECKNKFYPNKSQDDFMKLVVLACLRRVNYDTYENR